MLTESYDILTARESIATVRARSQLPEEEDNYESMEDDVSNYMYLQHYDCNGSFLIERVR